MYFILKSKILILCNVLVFLATILSLNYSVGNYVLSTEERPFDLSDNYEIYEKTDIKNINLKVLLDDQMTDYVMILENRNKDAIGIYDPAMYFYLRSIKVSSPHILRYFSKEDYVNERNVGICVDGCSLFDFTYLETLGNKKNIEVINCFENSPLAVNQISIIRNLFTIKEEIGNYVYIDSKNEHTMNRLGKTLQEIGYRKLSKPVRESIDLFSAIKFGLDSKHSLYLIISNMMLLILTAVISHISVEKMKRIIKLNFFYGCTISIFFKTFILPYLLFVMLGNLIIIGFLPFIISDMLYLSLSEYIVIIISYCLFLAVVYFMNFHKIYKEIKKEGYCI